MRYTLLYPNLYLITNHLSLPSPSLSLFIQPPNPRSKLINIKRSFSNNNNSEMISMDSPSAQRNKYLIWDILSKDVLPILPSSENNKVSVLEIACGCGVHTLLFASKMIEESGKVVEWLPSDPDASSRNAAQIRCKEDSDVKTEVRDAILPPVSLTLDSNGAMETDNIPAKKMQLIVCINMIHISPWSSTLGLMKLSSQKLVSGGILYCYGPYKVTGTAVESNLRFDESLKSRDSSWGVRNLEDVVELAKSYGLELVRSIEMPANNLSLVFRKK